MALSNKYKHMTSLFIFRRDLRLEDNTALNEAMMTSSHVIPLFIFSENQVSERNKYKSSNAIQFMVESLYDLDKQIRLINPKFCLWTCYGDEIKVIQKIFKIIDFTAIFINEDYTPYSQKRDGQIQRFCRQNRILYSAHTDILLSDTYDIYAKNGNPYHNFGLFLKKASKIKVRRPQYIKFNNFVKLPSQLKHCQLKLIDKYLLSHNYYRPNEHIAITGGRINALHILQNINQFKKYSTTRDYPAYPTTMLSAHNKFGTVSIREVYKAFTKEKTRQLIRNLYWRDFYYYVSIHFPTFYQYRHIFKPTSGNVKWENNRLFFKAWSNGRTGFPLVDAAMRQINTTGFMHNRARLVVSQFLTKDLLIDWKYGERYFSKKLVDIDRAQNLGNWNWSASFGLDSTPFLRIFNPWTQSKKYDPDCKYIKYWIPELANVPNIHIHQWYKYYQQYNNIIDYPEPIIDHDKRQKKFRQFYKKYFVNKS